jgi:SPP1 family predicted phage head-tail adaptor
MKLNRRSGQITAGDLKDRLTLKSPTYTPDGQGGNTVTYSDYGVVWCMAKPATNTRALEQAQLIFNDAMRFTIRVSQVPITADWQIVFNDNTFIIHTIDDIEGRHQYLSILAYSKEL